MTDEQLLPTFAPTSIFAVNTASCVPKLTEDDIDFSDIPEIRAIPPDAVGGLDALHRKLRGICLSCLSYTVIIEKAGT